MQWLSKLSCEWPFYWTVLHSDHNEPIELVMNRDVKIKQHCGAFRVSITTFTTRTMAVAVLLLTLTVYQSKVLICQKCFS